jgi:hypothetical protein
MSSVVAPPRYADREINKLSLDIQAASSSLGVLDEDAYYLEKDCKGERMQRATFVFFS